MLKLTWQSSWLGTGGWKEHSLDLLGKALGPNLMMTMMMMMMMMLGKALGPNLIFIVLEMFKDIQMLNFVRIWYKA